MVARLRLGPDHAAGNVAQDVLARSEEMRETALRLAAVRDGPLRRGGP